MAKRRVAVIAFLICFCFCLMLCDTQAASTTDAYEPINENQECSITLSYICDGIAFEGVCVQLYQIADVSADFQYTLTSPFASSGLILNGILSTDEWNVIRDTLEAYILADNIGADSIVTTDSTGQACFETLNPGLYFAVVGSVTQGDLNCFFDSALVALPGLGEDGHWEYQVAVVSKSAIIPPSDEEEELKVLKLWKGDEDQNRRPKYVEVEIFRDGTSYEKVVLSQENNWSYSWVAKDDGANWTVIERNTPSGYTMTVERRDTTFVLTNTFVSPNTDGNFDDPKTGDTSNIMLYVLLMIVSGSILIILGMIGERNAHEECK